MCYYLCTCIGTIRTIEAYISDIVAELETGLDLYHPEAFVFMDLHSLY
jgi:hypothetical protein